MPRYQFDSPDPNLPKKVAVDRYRKRIREEDANRGEANYAKAAAVGALAGLAARLKRTSASHRAMIGAGAGLLAEGITRAAGSGTKDFYGERSRVAKKSEKIPVIAGLGIAGHQAYRRIRDLPRKRLFESGKERRIEFTISPRLRGKLITAAALAGGITAADAATSAAYPLDDETRRHAAKEGLKRGAVYGSVLAASEPALRSLALRFKRTQFQQEHGNIIEFRSNDRPLIKTKTREPRDEDEDLRAQRRKLATYAGGGLLAAGALALLAKRPAGQAAVTAASAAPVKPAGRGTLARDIAAKALREHRGYVHLRPMTPGESKRFDKLPPETKAKVGKFASLAVHPQLSPGERQKFRKALGKLRSIHKFSSRSTSMSMSRSVGQSVAHRFGQLPLPIEFSSFIKDVAFKDLPAGVRKDVRAFHPGIADDTLLAHYGMVAKELAGKADPHNLATARKNVGKASKKSCADEVYAKRGKKFVLLNNDCIVDGHHFLAKAERGRVSASLHVLDLTPSRFQGVAKKKSQIPSSKSQRSTNLQRKLRRAVEFARGDQLNRWTARAAISGPALRKRIASEPFGILNEKPLLAVGRLQHVHDDLGRGRRLNIPRGSPANKDIAKILRHDYRQLKPYLSRLGFEARARRAVEFMTAPAPQPDLPDWVQQRRKNAKRRQQIQTAESVAGIAGGSIAVTEAALKLKRYLGHRIGKAKAFSRPIFFKRQQLREEGSDRWADPRLVAIGEQKGYYYGPGGQHVAVGDLPVHHAQVLRKVYRDASTIRRTGGRLTAIARDVGDVAAGRPRRTDAYGRPQKREWEKPYFHRVATDAAIGAATVGGLIALKKNPQLRARVMTGAREIKRKVNRHIPDFFAGRKFTTQPTELAALPIKYGGKIDYREQDYVYELAKRLRQMVRAKSGLPPRPPIGPSRTGGLKKPRELATRHSSPITAFDDIANYAGWDVRDPRGRSARVFAPGSRKRVRREKEWHEKIDNQRRLLGALAAIGTVAGAGAGIAIGRKFPRKVRRPFKLPGLGEAPVVMPPHTSFSRITRPRNIVEYWLHEN